MRPLAIVVLALACYANALGGSFHFDDIHAIVDNPHVRSLDSTGFILTDAGAFSVLPQNQGYRPLLLLSYAATATFTGIDASAFLAVNLLVHVLCALLVLATLQQTLRLLGRPAQAEPIAFLAALVFAAHPLFSECVNYVSARSESLSGLFMLAALYAYLRARSDARWTAWAVAAISAALLTKPVAAVFPALVLLFEAAAAERQTLRTIAPRWLAITAATVGFTLLGAHLTPELAFRSASRLTPVQYLRSELPAIWHYVRLFLWPVGQSGDPDYPMARSFFEPRVLAGGTALLAVTCFSVWGVLRRRCTGTALAIAWFLLCLAPASSILPLAEIVNEHRPYVAAASLCALLAGALVVGLPRVLRLSGPAARRATVAAAVLVLLVLGTATVLRNRVWRTEETLWTDVVSKAPGSARGQTNLGVALLKLGRLDEAEAHLREAVRLMPNYAHAHMCLGNLLLLQGRPEEAVAELDIAVALTPDIYWVLYFRALAAEQLQEPPERRCALLEKALRLSPGSPDVWYHLGLARDAAGEADGALEAARRAVELRGEYDDRFLLASLLLKKGKPRAALPLLEQLRRERPDDSRVEHNLQLASRPRGGDAAR